MNGFNMGVIVLVFVGFGVYYFVSTESQGKKPSFEGFLRFLGWQVAAVLLVILACGVLYLMSFGSEPADSHRPAQEYPGAQK